MKDDVPNIVLLNDSSAFEVIKLVSSDGIEYWLGRDLMPILGYKQWRQFEDAISRANCLQQRFAIASCQNVGNDCNQHFLRMTAKSSGGRPREDFKLSRYGAYLTAMNGDSRKPEITAAQSYFAVKTREAELLTVNQQAFIKLVEKVQGQDQLIEQQGLVIAQLQSQIQKLLPPSPDFTPPGWNPEVWESLPPQDKHHFRFLYYERGFIPSDQGIDPLEVPLFTTEQIKEQQRDELQQVIGDISQQELERLKAIKQELLQHYLTQED